MTAAPQSPSHLRYRPDVDGLRAVAILGVVGYHVGLPGFSGGFVGVDVFFVISGYLITGLLFEEALRTGKISLLGFYARRVRRLLPALFVVLMATLLLGTLLLLPLGEQQGLARSAIATVLFSANFYFWKSGGTYFDSPADLKPLLNMWTLAVEEQFYVVWPFLILVLLLLSKRMSSIARLCVVAFATVFVFSLALSWWTTRQWPISAFFLTPARAWEFAIGGLIAVALRGDLSRAKNASAPLTVLGLAAICASVTLFKDTTPFPGLSALLPTLGAAAVIAGGSANSEAAPSRMLASAPFVGIGLVSYSWYLWHWPLLSLGRAYELGDRDLARDGAIAVLALGLAWLTYRLVENPIRFGRPCPFKEVRSTLVAGIAMLLLALLPAGALGLWAKYTLANKEPYRQFLFHSNCNQDVFDEPTLKPLEQCLYGTPGAKKLIVLLGDSHGEAILPYLDQFGKENNVAVLQRTRYQCPPLIGRLPVFRTDQRNQALRCLQFNEAVLRELASIQDRDVGAFVSVWWPYYQNNGFVSRPAASILEDYDDGDSDHTRSLQVGVSGLLTTLESMGRRVVLLGPLPQWKYNVPECVLRHTARRCGLSREEVDRHLLPSVAVLRSAASEFKNARLWDSINVFCNRASCEPVRDGVILFRDEDHLSAKGAEVVGMSLKPSLLWLVDGRASDH